MRSIRARLLVWQIGALLLTGLLVSAITYWLAWDAFNRVRDYGLEQVAHSVVRHGVPRVDEAEAPADEGQFVSQIWAAGGTLLYSSVDNVGPPLQIPGLREVEWDDARWRVYTLSEQGMTIQVASSIANRALKFAEIVPWLLIPLAVLVVTLGLLIGTAVRRALAPLDRVRRDIGQRGAQRMHALDARGLPDEVEPLVRTLNDLLVRLDDALVAQRRFIADAAHELRTPMAAIKLQAQLLGRCVDEGQRARTSAELVEGVDRAAHLVGQLLRMARLEPSARHMTFVPVSLDTLAKETVADYSAQADARDIDLGIGTCEAVDIRGEPESLRMLLGNLLDNALRYHAAGGRVDVTVEATEGVALLRVIDNGPGIPAAERERVFDRFHRLAGAEIPGSGLGLSIVKQIVMLHGGHIELTDVVGGGLEVRVSLPLA